MSFYKSVLIVDDDPTQIAILTSYFSSLDVRLIQGASNPVMALEMMREQGLQFDLIVSDLQMPQMDGIEFMRHLGEARFPGKLALISGVRKNILDHAGRLAKMHRIDFLGEISKPLNRVSLDAVFRREVAAAPVREVEPRAAPFITPGRFAAAMRNRDIVPYYQPKVRINSGRIVGAESLARWQLPNGSFVSPMDFIAFAERNGAIEELTFYLFERSLGDLKRLLAIDPDFRLAVNLAPELAGSVDLPDRLNTLVSAHGISPANLIFEITENSILNVDVVTLEVLSRLRVLGYELAIDDFGTGSSNIQTLRDFPFSELKIDRSFICDALTNSFSAQTVKAAIALAADQKMKVVAEGVEDMQTWNMLRDMSVEQVQGYLVAQAMPIDEFEQYLLDNAGGVELALAS